MFGLDDHIASFSDGTTIWIVVAVAVLLGLRHATDPDHLAAVTALIASKRDRQARHAGRLGLAWGLGHATTLFAFGLPIVLFKTYLPERVQQGAETTIGLVIVALAIWLLVRWRRGLFHVHIHSHDGRAHVHAHSHGDGVGHAHAGRRIRSAQQAFGIGLVHGMGGSAGVGVLLLATIHSHVVAVGALGLFAVCTALSMAVLSTGFGATLGAAPVARSFARVAPVLGTASLLFGVWYTLGAQSVVPYYF
jgi:ABC-type nickel/cobalt efflux system permease component RcnA